MRIISGKFKNKKLIFPKNIKTRPLKDSVKENIFNILEHSKKINIHIKNSNILDLFSGCGSFGLESLSRYSSKVFFVEKDLDALMTLKKNIEELKFKKETFVYEEDINDFFQNQIFDEKFDIIFMDPPYLDATYLDLFKIILNKKILKKNHIIILHRERKKLENLNIKNFHIIEKRDYGRSAIFFGKLF
tara:strand:+ start:143 stop:709 length:567 start_codon:yes stop_codon:yes gene_type:complete